MTPVQTCGECGGPLPAESARVNRVYCSEGCRRRAERGRYYQRHPEKALEELRRHRGILAARIEQVNRRILEVLQIIGRKGGAR